VFITPLLTALILDPGGRIYFLTFFPFFQGLLTIA
jgi:hypothetical protein